VQVKTEADVEAVERPVEVENVQYQHADYDEALGIASDDGAQDAATSQPVVREGVKVGRNDPCPCGSGKKIQAVPWRTELIKKHWLVKLCPK